MSIRIILIRLYIFSIIIKKNRNHTPKQLLSIFSWYREDSAIPLQAPVNRGGSKDRQTTSTLSITPQREDDGAKYRCVVWNRAMPEGQPLETIVTLNVNCK